MRGRPARRSRSEPSKPCTHLDEARNRVSPHLSPQRKRGTRASDRAVALDPRFRGGGNEERLAAKTLAHTGRGNVHRGAGAMTLRERVLRLRYNYIPDHLIGEV